MTDWYQDSNVAVSGTGLSALSPKKTPEEITVAPGDKVYRARGSKNRKPPQQWTSTGGWTLDAYGTGELPIWTLARTPAVGEWANLGGGVYRIPASGPGMVMRNNVPLKRLNWSSGDRVGDLVDGSYLIDYTQTPQLVYMKISDTPSAATYEITEDTDGPEVWRGSLWKDSTFPPVPRSGVVIRNQWFRGAPRHCIEMGQSNALIQNCKLSFAGGKWDTAYNLGNHLEIGGFASGTVVDSCFGEYAYDTGCTLQNFEGGGTVLQNWVVKNSTFRECGLAPIEISTQATGGCTVRDGLIENCDLQDSGSWLNGLSVWANCTNNRGAGINLQSNPNGTGNVVTGITIRNNRIRDCNGAIQMVSFTGASNTITGNRCWNTKGYSPSWGIYEQVWGASSHTIRGNIISGYDNGIQCDMTGGSVSLTVQNNSFLACPTAIRGAGGLTIASFKNNLVNDATTAVYSGISGSGTYNQITNGSALGGYSLGTGDARISSQALEAAPSFAPPAGSALYSAGNSTGATYADYAGTTFGTGGLWAIGGVAAYPSVGGPAPTPTPPPAPTSVPRVGPVLSDAGNVNVLSINPSLPAVTTTTLPAATVGVVYSTTLAATGSAPITWTFSGLPPGMTGAAGAINGTPTVPGAYSVLVSASNAAGTTSTTLTLTVARGVSTAVAGAWATNLRTRKWGRR